MKISQIYEAIEDLRIDEELLDEGIKLLHMKARKDVTGKVMKRTHIHRELKNGEKQHFIVSTYKRPDGETESTAFHADYSSGKPDLGRQIGLGSRHYSRGMASDLSDFHSNHKKFAREFARGLAGKEYQPHDEGTGIRKGRESEDGHSAGRDARIGKKFGDG